MVLDFYKLSEQPFGVTPDPRYLFLSRTHREALESLEHGITSGRGFTALIADPGMGKTTLLFDLLGKVGEGATRVFLSQPQLTAKDLLRSVLEKFAVQDDSDEIPIMQRWLNECLFRESKAGKKVIVVIDEAQSLDEGVLEVVRMLSNFETSREKLLHLVLAGQPALAAILASPRLVQLRQRISIVARLHPFDAEETQFYIDHRLRIAGWDAQKPLFTKRALKFVAYHSGGIPRNINTICFNALSMGSVREVRPIDADVIETVVRNLDLYPFYGGQTKPPKRRWRDRFGKHTPSSPPVSSLTGRWWLRVSFTLVLLGALGGILTWSDWRSLHLTNPFGFLNQQSPTLPLISPPVEADSRSLASPKLDAAAPIDGKASQVDSTSIWKDVSALPSFVTVQPHQTVFRICMEKLGKYDDGTLTRLRELNPEIVDFTRIKVGQKVRLPAVGEAPKASRVIALRP